MGGVNKQVDEAKDSQSSCERHWSGQGRKGQEGGGSMYRLCLLLQSSY